MSYRTEWSNERGHLFVISAVWRHIVCWFCGCSPLSKEALGRCSENPEED